MAAIEGQDELGRKMVEEKHVSVQVYMTNNTIMTLILLLQLNLGLKEKMEGAEKRKARARSELKDSNEQAKLLEFPVLELEEGRKRGKSPSQQIP